MNKYSVDIHCVEVALKSPPSYADHISSLYVTHKIYSIFKDGSQCNYVFLCCQTHRESFKRIVSRLESSGEWSFTYS